MSVAVKSRPILFSSPMVKAILGGHKRQTRRILKAKDPNPERCITLHTLMANVLEWRLQDGRWFGIEGYDTLVYADCPYGAVGDRLWVRETFCQYGSGYIYRADYSGGLTPISDGIGGPWKPSIFMPRAASRITLEITGVRVERLHDISEDDARAEGVSKGMACDDYSRVRHFQSLWEGINGKESWDANPWLWVLEFQRCK